MEKLGDGSSGQTIHVWPNWKGNGIAQSFQALDDGIVSRGCVSVAPTARSNSRLLKPISPGKIDFNQLRPQEFWVIWLRVCFSCPALRGACSFRCVLFAFATEVVCCGSDASLRRGIRVLCTHFYFIPTFTTNGINSDLSRHLWHYSHIGNANHIRRVYAWYKWKGFTW